MDVSTVSYLKFSAAVIMIIIVIAHIVYIYKKFQNKRETKINRHLNQVKQILGRIVYTTGASAEYANDKQYGRKLETAKRILDGLIDLHCSYPLLLHYYALYHLIVGNFKGAEKCWKDAAVCDVNSPVPHTHLGNLYLEHNDHGKAAIHYKRAIQIDKCFAPPRVGMGNIKYFQGKIYSAMGFYSLANKISPDDPRALIGLGNCYRHIGSAEKAMGCYEQAYSLDRSEKALSAVLFDLYFAGKDYYKARKILVRAIRLFPRSPGFYRRLGDINTILNNENEAIDAYTNFLRFKCEKDRLTQFVRRNFEKYLALEIISDLVKGEKKINYALLVKELNSLMAGHLINQRLLGELNRPKKKAYQSFSSYFVNAVLLSISH